MTVGSSPYDVLLLDLNGTFMFGQDRFAPDEAFGETYRGLGGTRLSDTEVSGSSILAASVARN